VIRRGAVRRDSPSDRAESSIATGVSSTDERMAPTASEVNSTTFYANTSIGSRW